MAKINGGIIGPNNPTGPFSAGGVWRLEDAFNAQKAGEWPVVLGYQIPNSTRFNSGSSDNLSRTPASASNRKTWTWSGWVKRSGLGSSATFDIFCGDNGATSFTAIRFADDNIYVQNFVSGTKNNIWITNAVFRDVSAWYHIVAKFDTTQASSTNAVLIYINGVSQSITFDTAGLGGYVQNEDGIINSTFIHKIGEKASTNYFAGYMAEINFIDGQALTSSSFGETDATTGIWIPKAYTGTFGTNGFYLKFQDSSALGDDTSGNGNDWTVNNLTSIDQSYDSPTNNFATLNPIAAQAGSGVSSAVNTFTEGNLKVADLASDTAISNLGVSTGKWFWEVQVVTDQDGIAIGACNEGFNLNAELGYESPTSQANGKVFGYYGSGSKFTTIGDGTQFSAYGSAIAVNDIIGVALDLVNNQVTFYKNGTSQGTFSITALGSGESYFPAIGNWSASAVVANYNFGYPPFTISSGNADANGFGNFEYAVPSGYYALCTKNLALYG
jgi:hypothetical protein